MCVCGLGCVPRRTVPRRTAQTRLSQPACRLLARCRAGAAAAGVARVRALLQGHAPFVGLPAWAKRHQANPPLWAESEMHHPILGLDTAPRPLRLMIWT